MGAEVAGWVSNPQAQEAGATEASGRGLAPEIYPPALAVPALSLQLQWQKREDRIDHPGRSISKLILMQAPQKP